MIARAFTQAGGPNIKPLGGFDIFLGESAPMRPAARASDALTIPRLRRRQIDQIVASSSAS
jgi:hypothetical protein